LLFSEKEKTTTKLGMMVYSCNPSFLGDRGRRLTVQGGLKNKLKEKELKA
jgi:hypothetical protein